MQAVAWVTAEAPSIDLSLAGISLALLALLIGSSGFLCLAPSAKLTDACR